MNNYLRSSKFFTWIEGVYLLQYILFKILFFSLLGLGFTWTTPSLAGQSLRKCSFDILEEMEKVTQTSRPSLRAGLASAKEQKLLPVEIWLHVFGYLAPKTLSRRAQVCKEWKTLADYPTLWQGFLKRLNFSALGKQEPKMTAIVILNVRTVNALIKYFPADLTKEDAEDMKLIESFAELSYDLALKKISTGAIERNVKWSGDVLYSFLPVDDARAINDQLVEQRDPKAIERKIVGLILGKYGYKKDENFLQIYLKLLANS